eukprot:TRINITY_DN16664_c0_g1_i1.p1 TRINITY_DN16664_c0_g1~~TRINITY_DN16664_c0_g1_i1.p1  ORF type:complete len:409 (-),score=117.99 TRINITY_DN16664_c0_g1_i1:267-1463(-)
MESKAPAVLAFVGVAALTLAVVSQPLSLSLTPSTAVTRPGLGLATPVSALPPALRRPTAAWIPASSGSALASSSRQDPSSPSMPSVGRFSLVSAAAALGAAAALLWRRTGRSAVAPGGEFVAFAPQSDIAMMYTTGRPTGRRPTDLQNLFDRVSRLVRSNVTWAVQQLEDPEKVIEQAVTDMQADLIKIRQAYSEVLATQKRTEVKQKQVAELVAQWQKRAELALIKGDEELAREALRRKNAEQKALDGLNQQLNQSGPIAENLLNSMKLLEGKLDEAKANKAQLIARAKSAQTQKKVNDMLTGIDTGSAMAAFERMEEKVQTIEASAEVSGILAEGSSLDKRFKSLEGSSAVDDDLAALKRQITGSATPRASELNYLPAGADEDDEIAKMRKQLNSR